MIIELFGSPGSGKTYAINQIHPGAIREEKSTKDNVMLPIKKAIKSTLAISPNALKVRKKINNCLTSVSINDPQYKPVEISDFVNNIGMLSTVYKLSWNDVYMDEGIVHRTISMCINYGISKEVCKDIIQELQFTLKNVHVYYLDVSKEECYKSIVSRNRHLHSIDELQGESLDRLLETYDKYCRYICDSFKFKRIVRDDMEMNILNNS